MVKGSAELLLLHRFGKLAQVKLTVASRVEHVLEAILGICSATRELCRQYGEAILPGKGQVGTVCGSRTMRDVDYSGDPKDKTGAAC